ncbi:MAG: ABC transporter substrate-binding protein, partial [Gammaproteobacteria bacterium]|nr:ABC transporter substrate-binding protein [Gammaproteobacteria bacterium]
MFKHAVTQALQTLLLTLLMTSPADANTKIKDGEGNIIDVSKSNRIVSVGGAVTEIIYALGEEERLVGVDSTSLYPPVAQQLPSVGYIRTLPAEGILSLEPGMLIADGGAGPPEVIKQLESAGLPILQLADDPTLAGALNKIVVVGKA